MILFFTISLVPPMIRDDLKLYLSQISRITQIKNLVYADFTNNTDKKFSLRRFRRVLFNNNHYILIRLIQFFAFYLFVVTSACYKWICGLFLIYDAVTTPDLRLFSLCFSKYLKTFPSLPSAHNQIMMYLLSTHHFGWVDDG